MIDRYRIVFAGVPETTMPARAALAVLVGTAAAIGDQFLA